MIDIKRTLKELHRKFPLMSLDELFTILDCYVEELPFAVTNIPQVSYTDKIPANASTTIDTVYGTLSAHNMDYEDGQFTGSR